jgi:hypothetical protein
VQVLAAREKNMDMVLLKGTMNIMNRNVPYGR